MELLLGNRDERLEIRLIALELGDKSQGHQEIR